MLPYVSRFHNVSVRLELPLPAALRLVVPATRAQTDDVPLIQHANCACLTVCTSIVRLCMFDHDDISACEYMIAPCASASLLLPPPSPSTGRQMPSMLTFTCDNVWMSTRALHDLMLVQDTVCHTHPACPRIQSTRAIYLTNRRFIRPEEGIIMPVCMTCVQLTDAEIDARMEALLASTSLPAASIVVS